MLGYQEVFRLDMAWNKAIGGFSLVALLIFISYHFVDIGLASFILDILGPSFLQSDQVSNMPDLLSLIVCATTLLSWTGYLYLSHKGVKSKETLLCQLIGCTVPFSFFLKAVIKPLVGRTNTRVWLFNPDLYGLHWFHGGDDYSSFPSGHMAVFTCLALGFWRFYPRYRHAYLGFLFLLAVALIATEYHFLSDVIAGAYLGWVVDRIVHRCLRPLNNH